MPSQLLEVVHLPTPAISLAITQESNGCASVMQGHGSLAAMATDANRSKRLLEMIA